MSRILAFAVKVFQDFMDRGPQKGEGKKYLPQGEEPLHHSEDFYLLRTWSLHSSLVVFFAD